jgi:outer membrane protein assembly factor BamB
MNRRIGLLSLMLALSLTGCGTGSFFGKQEPPPLPGERHSVMLLEESIQPDQRIADLNVELPPAEANQEWPMAGGSPSHALGHLALGTSPAPAWRTSIGSGSDSDERLLSAPVVAEGRVFVIDSEGEVSAHNLSDGRQVWSANPELQEQVDRLAGGGIAWGDGRIYIAYAHGDVLALDAASGAEQWRQRLRAPVRASPTVAGDTLLVVTADNQLFALNAGSGEVVWRQAGTFEPAAMLGGASPAVSRGIVVVAYSSGEVFALSLPDGRPLWQDAVVRPRQTLAIGTITDIVGDPVIDDDRVFVAGNGGEMAAIDLLNGARAWDLRFTSRQTPWVAGQFIFALTDQGQIVCLLRQGGHVRWVTTLTPPPDPEADSSEPAPTWSGPVLAGDHLWVVSSRGELVGVSAANGAIETRTELPGPAAVPPVVADNMLLVLTEGGELVAYR